MICIFSKNLFYSDATYSYFSKRELKFLSHNYQKHLVKTPGPSHTAHRYHGDLPLDETLLKSMRELK